jgi:hypothetical protein
MFYISDDPSYSASTGFPDATDGETEPPTLTVPTQIPSVVINAALANSITPLDDSSSPFHGMLLYQRRTMRKPFVMVSQQLLGSQNLSGTVYAKWARVIFVANGTFDMRFAVGSLTTVNALEATLAPSELFPPAQDVYLVE